METIEAVLSAAGTGTLRTMAGTFPVAAEGDPAAARRLLLTAAEAAVSERGEACRLIIDDMGTRHVFALYPDGSRQPIEDDGTRIPLEQNPPAAPAAPAVVHKPSQWRREGSAPHPAPADLAPVQPAVIPPMPPLPPAPLVQAAPPAVTAPAAPLLPPAPLLVPGPQSGMQSVPEAAPVVPVEIFEPEPVRPGGNRFLRAAVPEQLPEEIETDSILGDEIEREGLGAQHQVRDTMPAAPAPERPYLTPESVWLLGASGGVGVSTLATLAGGRVIDGGLFPPHAGAPVYVVAATHAAGLEAAADVIRRRARGEVTVEIVGLVLVHDRPKLSKASIQLARQIASLYPRTMTVPFMPAWRDPGTPEVGNSVRVKRVISSLASKRKKKS